MLKKSMSLVLYPWKSRVKHWLTEQHKNKGNIPLSLEHNETCCSLLMTSVLGYSESHWNYTSAASYKREIPSSKSLLALQELAAFHIRLLTWRGMRRWRSRVRFSMLTWTWCLMDGSLPRLWNPLNAILSINSSMLKIKQIPHIDSVLAVLGKKTSLWLSFFIQV